jgi:hypothetical protein
VSGLLFDARLLLQQGAAAKQELAALKDSSAQQQQAYSDILRRHDHLLEEALVAQAKLAAAQAVAGIEGIMLKQLGPRLVLEAAAVLAARQAAEAACKSCTPEDSLRFIEWLLGSKFIQHSAVQLSTELLHCSVVGAILSIRWKVQARGESTGLSIACNNVFIVCTIEFDYFHACC